MGSTKTYREGPSWQGKNTNRGKESAYSGGPGVVRPEGTHMSSAGDEAKSKMRNVASGTRNKSSESKSTLKQKTTYGQS